MQALGPRCLRVCKHGSQDLYPLRRFVVLLHLCALEDRRRSSSAAWFGIVSACPWLPVRTGPLLSSVNACVHGSFSAAGQSALARPISNGRQSNSPHCTDGPTLRCAPSTCSPLPLLRRWCHLRREESCLLVVVRTGREGSQKTSVAHASTKVPKPLGQLCQYWVASWSATKWSARPLLPRRRKILVPVGRRVGSATSTRLKWSVSASTTATVSLSCSCPGTESSLPATRAPFLEPFWCSSGAILGALIGLLGRPSLAQSCGKTPLRTTITGDGGDDSQRVIRVIQTCGTHCHFSCVHFVLCPLNPEG